MPLPDLMLLEDALGADTAEKWPNYINDTYAEFCRTAAKAPLTFQDLPVICPFLQRVRGGPPKQPYQGKHSSFWHCTSEGSDDDDERFPDLARCERIRWIGWVIENANDTTLVRHWENTRQGTRGPLVHAPLWLHSKNYAVILDKAQNKYFLRSAYVLRPKREEDFQKEWDNWQLARP